MRLNHCPESRARAIIIGGSMSGLLSGLYFGGPVGRSISMKGRDRTFGRGAGIVAQQELIARLRDLASRRTSLAFTLQPARFLIPRDA
jgi:hypothetical protein